MDTVQDYLDAFLQLGDAAFRERFCHPFFLYADEHGSTAFKSVHTQMSDSSAKGVSGSNKPITDFRCLTPRAGPDGSFPSKMLVGRSQNRDLAIEHSTVSKRHAFIVLDEEKNAWKLGDSGSTNGTFLNGRTVDSGEPVYIRDGNIVSFGDCDYLFYSPEGFAAMLERLSAEG
ncbi:MAG: FHA domain-containing protein [Deltaproteobacteria bacterium]|nr:FHA domain-containing protein [Deltaproteobacteria bacterium]